MRTTVNVNFGGTRDSFEESKHPREGGKFTSGSSSEGGSKAGGKTKEPDKGHSVKWEKGTRAIGGKVTGSRGHKRGTLTVHGKDFSVTKHPWGQVSMEGSRPHGVNSKEVGPHSDVDTLADHIKKHLAKQ